MLSSHRACWSLATLGCLLIFAPGCERGLILRGDVGLELNHAPPVAGGCGPQGCHGQGGAPHGPPGFAQGPTWPAKPYRHPRFHALPIGPVFDPQFMPAAYTEATPPERGSGTRQPRPEPRLAPPAPQSELWMEPPEDPTYELPEPESTSYREPVGDVAPAGGPEMRHSGYSNDRSARAIRNSPTPDSGRWTRPQHLPPRHSSGSRSMRSAPHRSPAWTPNRDGSPLHVYRSR